MKFFTLVLSLFAMGCARYPYQITDRLANLPLESHQRKVAVLFAGDIPLGDYINIGVLEARGRQSTSYNQLVQRLQTQAQQQGADAVRILDKNYIEDTEDIVWIDTDITSVLSGVGILYVENADYLSKYVQAKEVYQYRNTTQRYDTLVCRVEVSYNGMEPAIEGDEEYARFTRNYSLSHLRDEKTPDWWYTTDPQGHLSRRGYRQNGQLIKTCQFKYDAQQRVSEVVIRYPSAIQTKEQVRLKYDKQGRLVEKKIFRYDKLAFVEKLVYNEQGYLTGSEYLQANAYEQLSPYLRVHYRFFDPENLSIDESLVRVGK